MSQCPACHAEQSQAGKTCSECGFAFTTQQPTTQVQPANSDHDKHRGQMASSGDSSSHGRFLPGAVIADRYRIVSLVGKGGMGEVYRADDMKLGHAVALKFLPRGLADDSERLDYFHSEVRLTRQISHPNVCRVYDIGEINGQHFLSMEYIDGEDLRLLLRRIGRVPHDKGVQIARQLCSGLAAAHDRGVLHRDLKPANIMLDGRGQVRITDFGLARLEEDPGDNKIVGTPAYMAPEQLAQGKTTIQSDLYSLGLILYELFTGRPVHSTNSPQELMRLHQESSVTAPSSLQDDMDPAVERVILRCLEDEAYQRPKSAYEVASGLPGADPLAAALAVGETPSPEMVAAAGETDSVSPRSAVLCLLGILLLLPFNFWLFGRTSGLSSFHLIDEPAVFADEAREILEQELGYQDLGGPETYGFSLGRPGAGGKVRFWFRGRPPGREFDMNTYWVGWGRQSLARPTFDAPPFVVPGEVAVVLTADRRLSNFRALAPLLIDTAYETSDANWSEWFTPKRTGYFLPSSEDEAPPTDLTDSIAIAERVTGRWRRPRDPYDQSACWKAIDPDTGDTVYLVAGAFQGKPTYFNALTAEDFSAENLGKVPVFLQWSRHIRVLCSFVIQFVGIVLAWRHYFSGRGDRRSALRLAAWVFLLGFVVLLTQTRYTTRAEDQLGDIFGMGVAQVLYQSAVVWLWYMALEPYVRRVWPHMLISSSRLINGRFRDSLVGRDLLVGMLCGLATVTVFRANYFIQSVLGYDELPDPIDPDVMTLAGVRELVGSVAFSFREAIKGVFFFIMVLIVYRIALGSKPRALVSCFLTLLSMEVLAVGGSTAITTIAVSIGLTLLLLSLARYGALALTAAFAAAFLILGFPITWQVDSWYFGHGMLAAVLILMMAGYGFYASQGGRLSWPESAGSG